MTSALKWLPKQRHNREAVQNQSFGRPTGSAPLPEKLSTEWTCNELSEFQDANTGEWEFFCSQTAGSACQCKQSDSKVVVMRLADPVMHSYSLCNACLSAGVEVMGNTQTYHILVGLPA